jgi:hypothetical protein
LYGQFRQDTLHSDYYSLEAFTTNPADYRVVTGSGAYYMIFFNHRFVFVKASDVESPFSSNPALRYTARMPLVLKTNTR